MREVNPLVSVNILTYNRKDELRNTLKKVYGQDYKNIEVIAVDNASIDGTSEMLKKEFPKVEVIRLEKNIGAPGYNYGFEKARGEYILILDDDSYPLEGTIQKGVERILTDRQTGIVAFNIFNNRYKTIETKNFKKFPYSFIGCGFLIKKSLLRTIGYYSEDYFLYHNELDLSARAYNAGYQIVYLEETTVVHNQSDLSRGVLTQDPLISQFRYYHMFISYSIFLIENFNFQYILKELSKWIINRLIICFKFPYFGSFVKACFYLLKNIKKYIKHRRVLKPEVQKIYHNFIPFVDPDFHKDFNKNAVMKIFKTRYGTKKPDWLIYINNTFAFLIFKLLSLRFAKRNNNGYSLLFINTGNLGDVVISTLIPENDDKIIGYKDIYLLVKEEFADLLKNYKGKVKIIKWNYKKYKWSLRYRINFLKHLHDLDLHACYNLTSARGITCDELALLSGAQEVLCLNSNWRYLKKLFGKKMDTLYGEILCKDILNEYDKHKKILQMLTNKNGIKVIPKSSKVFNNKVQPEGIRIFTNGKSVITVSPFTSDPERSFGIDNFKVICNKLSEKFFIILLGSLQERGLAQKISEENKNILNFAGQVSLSEIPGIIGQSELYIGNDSGLTHIALKLNIPLVAVIGGGTYGKYFPYEESEKRIYLYHHLECFGCEWSCILPERYCITEVKVDKVLSETNRILRLKKSGIDFHSLPA